MTDISGSILETPPAPSGQGLFLNFPHMGFYSGSEYQAFISASGGFLFKADDNNLISFGQSVSGGDGSSTKSFVLKSDNVFLSGSNVNVLTRRFFFGDDGAQFISGSQGNIEISSSMFHLDPQNNKVAISGSITATSEHPMLVWDNADHIYRFKEIFRLSIGDKLIRQDGDGIIEVPITTIDKVTESTEIVSINVEDVDTYLVNGYVTHNKGGNSHTDITAPTKVLGLSYSSPNLSWTEYTDATAYDVQVDNNSDFSSPGVNETEWNTNSIDDLVAFVDGTYSVGASLNARVRAIKSGLAGAWSDTLSFTL